MPVSEIDPAVRATIVLGLLLIAAAVAWRVVFGTIGRVRVAKALESPDAATRISAIDVATAHGLDRNSRALSKVVRDESDDAVLDALATAIARNAWEPADNPRTVELRLWAERRRHRPARAADRHGTPPQRVVVTGAGGPAGVNVIRALVAAGHEVIAVDTDPLAAGLHLASAAEVVMPADDPSFVDQILGVAREHRAAALISTLVEEMLVLSDRRADVEERVAVWLPAREALEACVDKWRFGRVMSAAGIAIPPTALDVDAGIPGPWVIKPRRSRGSRGVHYLDRADELAAAMRATDDPIVQTRMSGREFTVDALVCRDGELVGAVPRWRLETKAGISTKGRTFCDDRVVDGVTSVLAALGLDGAANVQGFVDGDSVTFVEVNPRFSGGLSLSLAAGADLVGEFLRGVLGLPIRAELLTFRPETTMIRHFEEIYT